MSSQPIHIQHLTGAFINSTNHLSINGATWNFTPTLLLQLGAHVKRAAAFALVRLKRSTRLFTLKSHQKNLNNFIGKNCTAFFVGDTKHVDFTAFQSIAANKSRVSCATQDHLKVQTEAFALYTEPPQQLRSDQISDKAAFKLDPSRPDLTTVLTNCLQRDPGLEFLVTENWVVNKETTSWIHASKLKLHLSSLFRPAYLIVRRRKRAS